MNSFDPLKIFINLTKIGNTVSVSVSIALHDAMEGGRIKPGDTVLISGFGVGLTWASALLQY